MTKSITISCLLQLLVIDRWFVVSMYRCIVRMNGRAEAGQVCEQDNNTGDLEWSAPTGGDQVTGADRRAELKVRDWPAGGSQLPRGGSCGLGSAGNNASADRCHGNSRFSRITLTSWFIVERNINVSLARGSKSLSMRFAQTLPN